MTGGLREPKGGKPSAIAQVQQGSHQLTSRLQRCAQAPLRFSTSAAGSVDPQRMAARSDGVCLCRLLTGRGCVLTPGLTGSPLTGKACGSAGPGGGHLVAQIRCGRIRPQAPLLCPVARTVLSAAGGTRFTEKPFHISFLGRSRRGIRQRT